ncbi:MAG: tetratricopeptide repeat protein [Bryobacteraceae bacterium]
MTFLLLGFVFCAAAQDEALVRLYREAQGAEASGDYRTATQRYEQIVALRPDMAEAYANLGNLYYVQQQWEQAAAALKKAVRLKPSLAAPHVLLGVLAYNGRELERAIGYLVKAEKLDPNNPLAPLYLGYSYFARRQFPAAAEALEKLTRMDPANEDAWYHLSKIHGQWSRQSFEVLQRRYPASFHTALARSHFFESGGSWERAGEELAKAAALRPADASLTARVGWLRRRAEGDASAPPESALAGSTRYLYAPPEGPAIQSEYERERLSLKAGEAVTEDALYTAAEAHQSMAFLASLAVMQTRPDSYRAHELRGEALEAGGKTDEAVGEYRAALAVKPDLQTIHFAIGNLYWKNGRMEDALVELREELKVNAGDPQTNYEIGDILLTDNKPAEAEKHYSLAVAGAPDMVEAHLALERIASARGDAAAAVLHLKKALALTPDDPTPHYRLWLVYRKQGRTAEAQAERAIFDRLKSEGK